ncbi:hypothetical protein M501DRAFT_910597, partial [Patellaria atrata CBS 101060]
AQTHDDGSAEYEVEMILNSKIDRRSNDPITRKKGLLRYLVKWKGFPDSDNSWNDWPNMLHCPGEVQRFHEAYPAKPGPHELF